MVGKRGRSRGPAPAGRAGIVSFVRLLLVVALATGCPRQPSAGRSTHGPNRLTGNLAGFHFDVQDAIVWRGQAGGREVAVVLLTDLEDACSAWLAGALAIEMFEPAIHRKGAHVLAWSVIGGEQSGGRIEPGAVGLGLPSFEGPSPRPPRGKGTYGFPLLGVSDEQCRTHYVDLPWPELQAELRLDSVAVDRKGPVTGRFTIGYGGDRLHGRFAARSCDLPPNTPRPPTPPCAPKRPRGRKLTPTQTRELARYLPLGPGIGRAQSCWGVHLSCLPAPGVHTEVERLEVSYIEYIAGRGTGAEAFPPPATTAPVWGEQREPLYWLSTRRASGSGAAGITAIERRSGAADAIVVYRADGESLEVTTRPRTGQSLDAVYRDRVGVAVSFRCIAPPRQDRWIYQDAEGDCP